VVEFHNNLSEPPEQDARPAPKKYPEFTLIPLTTESPPANVEVAVVDVALKYGAPILSHDSIPPRKVDVAEDVMLIGTVVVGVKAETEYVLFDRSKVLAGIFNPSDEVAVNVYPPPALPRSS
jgi:hypothetical protein